jgi:beta-glucanase (GH16 family)
MLSSATLALILAAAPAASQPASSEWEQIWADEFDGQFLNPAKWRAEDAALIKNGELQYYTPFALTFDDGKLVIHSERREQNGRPFTSGLIESYERFSMAFGRFEARMKLATTRGLWPAFWMLPSGGQWPPEIDIMEALGHEPMRVYGSNHWGVWPPSHSHKTTEFNGPDFSKDFHTFAVEWSPEKLDFFVDGKLYATHTEGVPQEPFYIIFNTAVGGGWPGNPDGTSVFPQRTEIDWVRASRRNEPGRAYLWAPAEGGEVRPSPRQWAFKTGETVRLEAVPEFGKKFVRWEGLPAAAATTNPVDVVMTSNTTARAIFEDRPGGISVISRGRPVLASSDEGTILAPQFAFDGSHATRWSSKALDEQWIQVDLGIQKKIDGLLVHFGTNHAREYSIQFSNDAQQWETAVSKRAGIASRDWVPLDGVARYVRVLAHNRVNNYGVSMADMRVYGRDLTR